MTLSEAALARRTALQARVLAWMDAPDPAVLDALFVEVHRWQHAHDAVLRALQPEPADRADAIAAVPVGLFRELDVGTVDPAEPHVAFHTSGTTEGRPGIHRIRTPALYDAGSARHARPWLPRTRHTWALLPDGRHSSLAHMIRSFHGLTGPVRFLQDGDRLDTSGFEHLSDPVFVCATAFALDTWIARGARPLPAGSAILVTGGFKGRVHTLDADELVQAAQALAPVVLEYGMTELSSQLWARPGEPYQPPPWLRVTAVAPDSGVRLPPGERGQLRFLDLCNLDGTLHVETLDEGTVHADGTVTLHGRLPDAPLRGCSLTAEDLR